MGTEHDSTATCDRTVYLVTGGAGSIGGALTKRLLETPTNHVRIFSRNDSEQHEFLQTVPEEHRNRLRMILGDVRDRYALDRAMHNIDCVFHCAAIKHVGAANYSAEECASINIMGTANLISSIQNEGAIQSKVIPKIIPLILLSTDKAVNPTNVMGTTKAVAEQIVLRSKWASHVSRRIVRFGNVFDSRGSLFPVLVNSILKGLPITITSYKATRYIIPIKEAVDALIVARDKVGIDKPFILVPRMKTSTVEDIYNKAVTHAMEIKNRGYSVALPSPETPKATGLILGEKMHEQCISSYEKNRVLDWNNNYVFLGEVETGEGCPWIGKLMNSKGCERLDINNVPAYYTK